MLQTGVQIKSFVKHTLNQGTLYTFSVEARNDIGYSLMS